MRFAASIVGGVVDDDVAAESAAGRPVTFHRGTPRLYDRDEVVHDAVGHSLVKNALAAESLQIHLQTFQLDAVLVRDVGEHDRPEIWLTRFGTHRGEFGAVMFDCIIS